MELPALCATIVAATYLIASPAKAAELKLMVSGAMAEPIGTIATEFARRTQNKIEIIVGTTQSQERRIRAGEHPDLIEVNSGSMDALEKDNALLAGTRVRLARANIAIAVPEGRPIPKITTAEDLKRVLLSAKTIALTDPKIRSQATEAIQRLLQRLGIQKEMLAKTVPGETGLDAVKKMAEGRAELAISFESEILPVPGARLVGRVPEALQDPTIFEGAVGAGSPNPDAAKALLREIAAAHGREVMRQAGLEPLSDH